MKSKKLWAAVTMFGGIVGAGAFGVPFVFSRSGVGMGLVYVAILGSASAITNVFYAIVAAETDGKHRLVGYARQYFGKKAARLVAVINLVEFYGALLAYVILAGSFLSSIFGGQAAAWSLVFWAVASVALFMPLKKTESIDHALTFALVSCMAVIIFIVWPKIDAVNFVFADWNNWFLPYGVIFFALTGSSVVPEIVEIMKKNERASIAAVVGGTLAAAAFVAIFGLIVVGVCGGATTQNAIVGLEPLFGKAIVVLGSLLGLAAVMTQFVIIGANVRDQYVYDFKMRRLLGWFIAVIVPFIAFVAGAHDFIGIIGFLGATLSATIGIIIVAIGRKVLARRPRYGHLRLFAIPLMILFAAGIIAEIVSLAK